MEKQYDARSIELQMQKMWDEEGTYQTDVTVPVLFSIDTPPPTVSGSLHIGHIFSYTQTDIIARYQRLDGHEVMYPFGFDDNGLPTERFVEKRCGVSPHALGRSAFIQLCLQETKTVEADFRALWTRMGLSIDWRLSYATIDAMTRRISQESFIRLYQKGFVYRKAEPSLYCTTCRTAVAQAELDDVEEPSTFYDIVFREGTTGADLVIATTRPELLPACVALLYHPSDSRYQHLQGLTARVPLFGFEVPIRADEQVVPEKGTGLVMCCTFGDTTDIHWWKTHQLPYRPAIGEDGRWLPETGILAGLKAKAARETVVKALVEAGFVKGSKPIAHVVNVHERCKHAIEFLVLPQWFLQILPHKQALIACADEIEWFPAFMKTRYINWVEQITWDWCLSRQRLYGIPFPTWHCTTCKAVMCAEIEQLPIDPQEHPWVGGCRSCGADTVVADRDVMDTWNTSSLTPLICEALRTGTVEGIFEQPYTPMAMRPQAHDIIRTWAFYTIVKTWMHFDTIPWRSIVISGHVLSTAREKISKSQGNAMVEPHTLLEKYPADVIRYWTASGSLGYDVAFSEQQLQQGNRFMVKLWNAFRFIGEYTVGAQLSSGEMAPEAAVHRWILHQATATYDTVRASFTRNEYAPALDAIERFFWSDFCDTYLELVKDPFFNSEKYSPADVAETKTILLTVGLRILQLISPYMPHIAESLYQQLYASRCEAASIHKTAFAAIQHPVYDTVAAELMGHVNHIVGTIRRLKTDHKLSLKVPLTSVTICVANEALRESLEGQAYLIAAVARAEQLVWATQGDSDELIAQGDAWSARVVVR